MTDEYIPSNREKSKQATKAKYWCGCDRTLIGDHGRCSKCNRKSKPKKLKKY